MTALLILNCIVTILWARLAYRSIRLARRSPRLSDIPDHHENPDDLPNVVAIVPAHNEQNGIETIVRHILRQDWPAEKLSLIVVNDQSTDRTGEILDSLSRSPEFTNRLTIIHGQKRPPGWAGKTWAVHQATISNNGEPWVWMVDSDMRLSPSILKVAYGKATQSGADLVSLTAGVDATTVAQKATSLAMIHLLWQLYPLPLVNDEKRAEALAHGAFLLIKREMYEKIGGIESLRHEIIEDIRLAQKVKMAGGVLAVHPAPGLTRTDFYGSRQEILDGLRKNAYAGMDYMPHKFWIGLIMGIFMCWIPVLSVLAAIVALATQQATLTATAILIMGLYGWILQAESLWPIVIYLDLRKYYALSLPLGGTLYMYACWLSYWDYIRGRVVWRGRDFQVSELNASQDQAGTK
jgi:cellulose synthase/poly-beta-1,6-N-acetylglucosamine synthase-like glycosyltransferase